MDALDMRVSAALTQLRALATAVHSPQAQWELEVSGVRSRADRIEHADGVCFEADFAAVPERGTLALLCDGREVLVRPFERPPNFVDVLAWDLSLGEEFAAA